MYLREKSRRPETAHPRTARATSGYRFLDPELGRFVSRDPIGEEGGRNVYRAFLNNSVDYIDVYGEKELQPARLPLLSGVALLAASVPASAFASTWEIVWRCTTVSEPLTCEEVAIRLPVPGWCPGDFILPTGKVRCKCRYNCTIQSQTGNPPPTDDPIEGIDLPCQGLFPTDRRPFCRRLLIVRETPNDERYREPCLIQTL